MLVHYFLKYGAKGVIERLCHSISQLVVLRGMVSFDLTLSVQFIQSWALEKVTIISCDGFWKIGSVDGVDQDKFDNLCCGEIPHRNCFSPFGKVVSCG